MCLKSPGTPLKASSAHICPRTFETHFISLFCEETEIHHLAHNNTLWDALQDYNCAGVIESVPSEYILTKSCLKS